MPAHVCPQAGPGGLRIAELLDDINAQSSVRVSERDLRLALNELVSVGKGSEWKDCGALWHSHGKVEQAHTTQAYVVDMCHRAIF